MKKETLNYKDVENLIGPPPYGEKKLIEPSEFDEMTEKSDNDKAVETTRSDSNNNKPSESVSST